MARESRPSARQNTPTPDQVRVRGTGILTARRRRIEDRQSIDLPLPAKITTVVFKNAGNSPLHINFNNDPSNQYWTLLFQGDQTPEIPIDGRVVAHVRAPLGNTVLECLFWG